MELYTKVTYRLSEKMTRDYSTSFSLSSSLFDKTVRPHIYAIYGMVRIADEIVDTYQGEDIRAQLDTFEKEVLAIIQPGASFSTNPIIHAFGVTARQFAIDAALVTPFFESMRTDISETRFTKEAYDTYIYGSAEVIGLMCLKIFTSSPELYAELAPSAQALGSAYQKVNFLRDIADDHKTRGRFYFPDMTFDSFDDAAKHKVEADIEKDFLAGKEGISKLPLSAKKALSLSYNYYYELFIILKKRPAEELKQGRIRLPSNRKAWLLAKEAVRIK